MSINNLLLLLLLAGLTACTPGVQQHTTAPASETTVSTGIAQISESERNDYRNAITALNSNNFDLAEKILKEMLKARQDLAGPWANLGLVYLKKNDVVQARSALGHALQLNPKQAYALNLMGVVEYNAGNAQKATDYYLAALQSKPDYANAHYNIALLYDIIYQDLPKAVEHYQQYMTLTNNQDKDTATWLEQLSATLKSK